MTTPAGHLELARLRRECPIAEPRPGVKMIVGCDEAVQILRDTTRFSGRHDDTVPAAERMLIESDPIDHGPRRRVLGTVLSPERLNAAGPLVAAISGRLVAGVVANGSAELVEDLAAPLIAEVVATLVGIPEADRDQVYSWVVDLARDDGMPRTIRGRRLESLQSFRSWALAQADRRRLDARVNDGLALLTKPDPVSGRFLSDDELVEDLRALCTAGIGASRRLTANLLYEVISQPGLFTRMKVQPELASKAVEESLRHTPPIQFLMRTCTETVDVAGVQIAKGDRVVVSLSSINRDEKRYDRADEFVVDRDSEVRHLAFGRGAHYCPGARVARAVAAQALRDLTRCAESVELAQGFVYSAQQSLLAWGPRRLDVVLTPTPTPPAARPAGRKKPEVRGLGE
jgi:cytochrome P450